MKPYSLDLRQRVVTAGEDGDGTIAEVAAMFRVSKTFVKKMLRLWRERGELAPHLHGGGAINGEAPQSAPAAGGHRAGCDPGGVAPLASRDRAEKSE